MPEAGDTLSGSQLDIVEVLEEARGRMRPELLLSATDPKRRSLTEGLRYR